MNNTRKYLPTMLFNARSTIDSYYQAEVNHDSVPIVPVFSYTENDKTPKIWYPMVKAQERKAKTMIRNIIVLYLSSYELSESLYASQGSVCRVQNNRAKNAGQRIRTNLSE